MVTTEEELEQRYAKRRTEEEIEEAWVHLRYGEKGDYISDKKRNVIIRRSDNYNTLPIVHIEFGGYWWETADSEDIKRVIGEMGPLTCHTAN